MKRKSKPGEEVFVHTGTEVLKTQPIIHLREDLEELQAETPKVKKNTKKKPVKKSSTKSKKTNKK